MPPAPHPGLVSVYAKQWKMSEEIAAEWLSIEPMTWAKNNAKVLHDAGLKPAEAQDLFRRVDKHVAADMGRLVDAGRMGSLDTRYLHWWAASGLLRPVVDEQPLMAQRGRARPKPPSYTRWVTEARGFIAATGGDQELAALAAAVGLTAQEAKERFDNDDLDDESLRVLVAFLEAGRPAALGGPP